VRNLVGHEMTCFCHAKHFELTYAGGGLYHGPKEEPIEDLLDMNCYVCTASYYTRGGDAIAFCPNCGHFDRKRFNEQQELVEALRGQDFTWLKGTGLSAFMVKTWDGDWQLKFAKSSLALDQTGKFQKVVAH